MTDDTSTCTRRAQIEAELKNLGYRVDVDAGAIPGEGHLLLTSEGRLVDGEDDDVPDEVLVLAREWSEITDRLMEHEDVDVEGMQP